MATEIQQNQIARPPVVAVLGHIDHGKSTLLDYIRKESTVTEEAGGITQRISAYEVLVGREKRRITFLDTPGHAAFCSMRERGSKVADIVILVVSAEDGVKPQTLEALKCIKEDQTPFIVAINKIDKPSANIDKTKQNLAENEVLVEGWGGTIPVVATSAKTGDGIDELLELILLQADILELKGDPSQKATGFVIESNVNPQKGVSTTLIIKNGTLKKDDVMAVKGAFVPIRSIEYFDGSLIDKASFSSPVRITGWNNVPAVGEEFCAFETKTEAEQFAKTQSGDQPTSAEQNADKHIFPLVIKADTLGSLEALLHELQKMGNEKMVAKVVSSGIGAITERDVKSATASKASIVGFAVTPDKNANILAMRDKIEIKTFSIIYDFSDWVESQIEALTPKEKVEVITGQAKILKTFSQNRDKQVVGGRVETGEIKSGSSVKILRRENHIGDGKIKELQSKKMKVGSVSEPQEFGANIESKTEIAQGDVIVAVSI